MQAHSKRCDPRILRYDLRTAALALGADVRARERIVGWEAGDGGIRVQTTRGAYVADRLVVTAGP